MVPPPRWAAEQWRMPSSDNLNEENRLRFYKGETFPNVHDAYLGSLFSRYEGFPAINPQVVKATKDTYDWLLEHGVDTLFTPESYREFVGADFPILACMIYTAAEPQGIDWACKFFTWLCAVDELMELAIGMPSPALLCKFAELQRVLFWTYPEDPVLRENYRHFLVNPFEPWYRDSKTPGERRDFIFSRIKEATVRDQGDLSYFVYPGNLGPLGSCLRDLWRTCVVTMPKESNLRLAKFIQLYLVRNMNKKRIREETMARIGENGTAIPIENYLAIHSMSGAIEPTLVIVEIVYQVQLSEEFITSPSMRQILTTINEIITCSREVWTFRKNSSKENQVFNLVSLITQRDKCTYAQAALVALEMVVDKLEIFDTQTANLTKRTFEDGQPKKPPETYQEVLAIHHQLDLTQKALSRCINTCLNWVIGTQKRHMFSPRHND